MITHEQQLAFSSWKAMIRRCQDSRAANYADYGGRGIAVCDRWLSFEAFLADMGERPSGTSIERKDNSGDYEPTNCCWVTPEQQAHNRRNSRLFPYRGEMLCISELARIAGIIDSTLRCRLEDKGWDIERAMQTPPASKQDAAKNSWDVAAEKTEIRLQRMRIAREKLSLNYRFVAPEGDVFIVRGLSTFCLSHGLTDSAISGVIHGKRKHHKGWTVTVVPDAVIEELREGKAA